MIPRYNKFDALPVVTSLPGASRRQFMGGALGLVIGFNIPGQARAETKRSGAANIGTGEAIASGAPEINAFIRIAPDNTITVLSKHIEFGQGPYTGLATIVADELDADWAQMRVEAAPADVKLYANLALSVQGTGGSTAISNSWDQLRKAGAQARAQLVAAAAEAWKVPAKEITVSGGKLAHASGKSATFGEFAEAASKIKYDGEATPKKPDEWRYIGKPGHKLDTKEKLNGSAIYTIDVKLPDQLTCVIARPTRFGANSRNVDAKDALAVPGVVEVVTVPQGVAVLAKTFWAARKGRDAVKVEWDEAGTESRSSSQMRAEMQKLAREPGAVARNDGKAADVLSAASGVVEAEYDLPYLAHAPMEPLNCVIRRVDGGGVEMIYGCQFQTVDQMTAASVLGLKPEQITIKTLLAGGSFGRRATPGGDIAFEAAHVMKAAKHQGPIKIIWTREDDIRGARYRPVVVHRCRGSVKDGTIEAWDQTVVGQFIVRGSAFEGMMIKDGIEALLVEGAKDLPYEIANMRVTAHEFTAGLTTLWFRSVGHSHTAFVTETFFDTLAEKAGADPVELRRKLLAKHPRALGVLNLAAETAGWGSPVPQGRARGIAVHESFTSFVAQVAEVSAGPDGFPKVERVICAVDCGRVVNPDIVKAQMEGGIGFGLSAALFGAIDLDDGRVVQSNFHDYRCLRIDEMPSVEVHIVPSAEAPTGVGEPGVPPIAPAVANAWAKLTGKRVTQLPFSRALAKS